MLVWLLITVEQWESWILALCSTSMLCTNAKSPTSKYRLRKDAEDFQGPWGPFLGYLPEGGIRWKARGKSGFRRLYDIPWNDLSHIIPDVNYRKNDKRIRIEENVKLLNLLTILTSRNNNKQKRWQPQAVRILLYHYYTNEQKWNFWWQPKGFSGLSFYFIQSRAAAIDVNKGRRGDNSVEKEKIRVCTSFSYVFKNLK